MELIWQLHWRLHTFSVQLSKIKNNIDAGLMQKHKRELYMSLYREKCRLLMIFYRRSSPLQQRTEEERRATAEMECAKNAHCNAKWIMHHASTWRTRGQSMTFYTNAPAPRAHSEYDFFAKFLIEYDFL